MLDQAIYAITQYYAPLSPEAVADVKKCSTIAEVKSGDILVREGDYSNTLYFVVEGGIEAFYVTEGKTIVDWFAFENDFISAIVSFFLKVPSQHNIKAIEDSKLLQIQREDVERLCEKYHDMEHLGRLSVTKTMLQLQQRMVSFQFRSSKERYNILLEKYPKIELRVPLGDIASYLGITQETLSRLRNPKRNLT